MADHVERQVAREVVERGAEETEDGLRQRMVEERLRRRRVIRDAVLVEERRERDEIRVEHPCHDGDLFGRAAGIEQRPDALGGEPDLVARAGRRVHLRGGRRGGHRKRLPTLDRDGVAKPVAEAPDLGVRPVRNEQRHRHRARELGEQIGLHLRHVVKAVDQEWSGGVARAAGGGAEHVRAVGDAEATQLLFIVAVGAEQATELAQVEGAQVRPGLTRRDAKRVDEVLGVAGDSRVLQVADRRVQGAGEVVRSCVRRRERTFTRRFEPAQQQTLVEKHVRHEAIVGPVRQSEGKLEEIGEPDREQSFGEATRSRELQMADETARRHDHGRRRERPIALYARDLGPQRRFERAIVAEYQARAHRKLGYSSWPTAGPIRPSLEDFRIFLRACGTSVNREPCPSATPRSGAGSAFCEEQRFPRLLDGTLSAMRRRMARSRAVVGAPREPATGRGVRVRVGEECLELDTASPRQVMIFRRWIGQVNGPMYSQPYLVEGPPGRFRLYVGRAAERVRTAQGMR